MLPTLKRQRVREGELRKVVKRNKKINKHYNVMHNMLTPVNTAVRYTGKLLRE